MDRRAGGVDPALPGFLGLFRLLHDHFLLSLYVFLVVICQSRETHGIQPDPADLFGRVPRRSFLSLVWFMGVFFFHSLIFRSVLLGLPVMPFVPGYHPPHKILLGVELDPFFSCDVHHFHTSRVFSFFRW